MDDSGQYRNVSSLANILVSDYSNQRVQVFDKNGNWINTFGKDGNDEGSFDRPMGITVDNENGDIYVVDYGNNRVMMF